MSPEEVVQARMRQTDEDYERIVDERARALGVSKIDVTHARQRVPDELTHAADKARDAASEIQGKLDRVRSQMAEASSAKDVLELEDQARALRAELTVRQRAVREAEQSVDRKVYELAVERASARRDEANAAAERYRAQVLEVLKAARNLSEAEREARRLAPHYDPRPSVERIGSLVTNIREDASMGRPRRSDEELARMIGAPAVPAADAAE